MARPAESSAGLVPSGKGLQLVLGVMSQSGGGGRGFPDVIIFTAVCSEREANRSCDSVLDEIMVTGSIICLTGFWNLLELHILGKMPPEINWIITDAHHA